MTSECEAWILGINTHVSSESSRLGYHRVALSNYRLPRWVIAMLAGLLLSAGVAVAAWSVELPYFAFSPGPVGNALDAIEPTDELAVSVPEGELFFLTVSVQQVNIYEAVVAAFDPALDLVRMELLRREGESDEEFQERNLQAMDISEQTAILVALERLGIDIITDGVEVIEVIEGLPADGVLMEGDLIRSFDGAPIEVLGDVTRAMADKQPGDRIGLEIERDGMRIPVEIQLETMDEEPERPVIGIRIQNLNPRFPVEIDSGSIGGPSAGMMYTLAVINLLSDDELAPGVIVAGTGTIAADGSVGPIGGIRQKVVAAEAAGADVILVPEENYDEALTSPVDSIEIVSVATIDDAVTYLSSAAA